jgi:arsenate reductase
VSTEELGVLEENGVRRSASEEGVDQLVALGRALCDPVRVRMLSMMADGRSCCDFSGSGVPADEGEEGICVCEFEEVFGMGQSKVSYHVKKLKDAGLVRGEVREVGLLLARPGGRRGAARRGRRSPARRRRKAGRVRWLLLRHLSGDCFKAFSACTEATRVRPRAIMAMEEIGINISGQESKTLDRYLNQPFDYVITVCDDANEACPFFPGDQSRLHWSLEEPSAVFRSVRDRIGERVQAELVNGGG